MSFFKMLLKCGPVSVFLAIVLGALSGIAYAKLIPTLMSVLTLPLEEKGVVQFWGVNVVNPEIGGMFLFLCLMIIVTRTASQILLTRISLDVTTKLRQNLYSKILNTSVSNVEKHSNGQLIQSVTTDVQRVVQGAGVIPDLTVQIFTLAGLLGYLFFLNKEIFLLVLFVTIFGVITFQLPMMVGSKYFSRARNHMDLLQEGFKALVGGVKELKLNNEKCKHFMENNLLLQEREVVKLEKTGFTVVRIAQNYGDLIGFFTIGAIVFVFVNYINVSVSELVGVVMVLLYMIGPVAFVLNVAPLLIRAKVSLKKIQSLYDGMPDENASKELHVVPDWDFITLKSVCYRYKRKNNNENGFFVGPVDVTIKCGEITFFVGGNGSGKSTVSKVLSLHYPVFSGEIFFGKTSITLENINSYRQQVACIYSDYYLFESLHGEFFNSSEVFEKVSFYLDTLQLTGKVEYRNGRFSTLKLSDGQRRRLALLVALLDDKFLYVFDEWAADQDPIFKNFFYSSVLPDLKDKGKAVVVISHDDRYFHLADQILTMEEGQLI